eukprot:9489861-Pyramimonas_sp.AAC.3
MPAGGEIVHVSAPICRLSLLWWTTNGCLVRLAIDCPIVIPFGFDWFGQRVRLFHSGADGSILQHQCCGLLMHRSLSSHCLFQGHAVRWGLYPPARGPARASAMPCDRLLTLLF